MIDRLIEERRRDDDARGEELLTVLLSELEPQHARDQLLTLLLAGHETTANALAFACHLLATHQDIQAEAAHEVIAVCGVGGPPSKARPQA